MKFQHLIYNGLGMYRLITSSPAILIYVIYIIIKTRGSLLQHKHKLFIFISQSNKNLYIISNI